MNIISRLNAALMGKYEVEREIGAGGMATVYLARDLRHSRPVALKVLRPELGVLTATDRFLAEIGVTAKLQHPNLLQLFDSGDADGLLFYVMPYIEGESLRSRLDRERQLPVDQAVQMTCTIARALEYAHRRGVIHRDLKPENILIVEGQPLVADFGIALAVTRAAGERITQSGLTLGTPQYMSPEQATGEDKIDARSDIYSLAAMSYEMLAGSPPHSGPTAQSVISRVVTEEPRSVTQLRPSVPLRVASAIKRGLAKVPADRFSSAAEFAAALEEHSAPADVATDPGVVRAWPRFVPLGGLLAVGLITGVMVRGFVYSPRPAAGGAAESVELPPDAPLALGVSLPVVGYSSPVLALSPGGTWLVYVAHSQSGRRLHLRDNTSGSVRELGGTDGVVNAFFSPGGREIGFLTDTHVKRLSLETGSVVTLAEALRPVLGWWPRSDSIYFAVNEARSLSRTPASGGTASPDPLWSAVEIGGGSISDLLPDGRVLATSPAGISGDSRSILLVDLLSRRVDTLLQRGYAARYLRSGHLLFVSNATLMVVPFDLHRSAVTGAAVPLQAGLTVESLFSMGQFAASATGLITYVPGADLSSGKLAFVDRAGAVQYVDAPEQVYGTLDLAPDDSRIAVHVAGPQDFVLIWDIRRNGGIRVRSGNAEGFPLWNQDGTRIATRSWTTSLAESVIRIRAVSGSGDITRDSLVLALRGSPSSFHPESDVIAISKPGSPAMTEFVDARTAMTLSTLSGGTAKFSADARYVAHTMVNPGSTGNVMVTSYPDHTASRQISTRDCIEPRWVPSGLLFCRSGSTFFWTAVTTAPALTFDTLSAGLNTTEFIDTPGISYDVTSDGMRLLLVKRTRAPQTKRIAFIRDWLELAERGTRQRE